MKRSIWLSFFLSVLTLMILTGCDTRRDDNRVDDRTTVTDENKKDATGTDMNTDNRNTDKDITLFEKNHDYTYDQRDQFKSDVDNAFDRIDERIDHIGDKIDDMSGQTKDMYNKKLDAIKDKRDKLEKRMDNFDNTKDNNWNQFKSSFRTAWMDLRSDIDKLGKDVGSEDYIHNQTGTRTY
jgi:hypothetical protein